MVPEMPLKASYVSRTHLVPGHPRPAWREDGSRGPGHYLPGHRVLTGCTDSPHSAPCVLVALRHTSFSPPAKQHADLTEVLKEYAHSRLA